MDDRERRERGRTKPTYLSPLPETDAQTERRLREEEARKRKNRYGRPSLISADGLLVFPVERTRPPEFFDSAADELEYVERFWVSHGSHDSPAMWTLNPDYEEMRDIVVRSALIDAAQAGLLEELDIKGVPTNKHSIYVNREELNREERVIDETRVEDRVSPTQSPAYRTDTFGW